MGLGNSARGPSVSGRRSYAHVSERAFLARAFDESNSSLADSAVPHNWPEHLRAARSGWHLSRSNSADLTATMRLGSISEADEAGIARISARGRCKVWGSLALVPLFAAGPSMGFVFADKRSSVGMPPFVIVFISHFILFFGFTATLRLRYGIRAVSRMVQWKYAWLSVSGTSKAVSAALVCMALQQLKSPTSVESVLLVGIAFYVPLEVCIYQRIPSTAKTAVMLLVLCLSTVQSRLQVPEESSTFFHHSGAIYAAIAACLNSASDVWIEIADPRNDEHAESLRVLAFNSLFSLPVCMMCIVYLEFGWFTCSDCSWFPEAMSYCVLPLLLYHGYMNLCITWFGATRVALVDSLTVCCIFVIEWAWHGTIEMKLDSVLAVSSLTMAVALAALIEIALDAASVRDSVRLEFEDYAKKIAIATQRHSLASGTSSYPGASSFVPASRRFSSRLPQESPWFESSLAETISRLNAQSPWSFSELETSTSTGRVQEHASAKSAYDDDVRVSSS